MKTYTVKIAHTFTGELYINARGRKEAERKAMDNFGISMGDTQSTDGDIKDWDICMSPVEKVSRSGKR